MLTLFDHEIAPDMHRFANFFKVVSDKEQLTGGLTEEDLERAKTRLARILAATQAQRLRVLRLAPSRHIAVSVTNQAATVYWAIAAVLRTSVDTTCLQKPKTRLARILAAARPRHLLLVQLAPCRHIAVSFANRAATVY